MNRKEFEIKQQLKAEAGKYILDLTKLVFAGIVVAGIFNVNANKLLLVIVGFLIVSIGSIFGFYLLWSSKRKKKDK